MLPIDKLVKALGIIENLLHREFVSAEFFSDGSGHIVDDSAEIVLEWNNSNNLEDQITKYIEKRSRQ